MNNNVIELSKYKETSQEYIVPEYAKLKENMIKLLKDNCRLVGRNELEARAISKIMMELDPTINYCKITFAISKIRGNVLFEVDPVRTDQPPVAYCHSQLTPSYIQYLQDNDLIEMVDDYGGIIKD